MADARGIKAAALIHAARIAATGSGVSPGIFEVLALLGKPLTLSRLRDLVRYLRGSTLARADLRRLFSHGVADGELQRRRPAVPDLEVGEEPVLVREAEREERAGVRAPVVVLAHEHHRRSASLIHAPRAADLNVIQEFDVEGRRRIIAAEPAVDAGPEPETLKQLARLEVRADERLFRVDRDAALESDALRIGTALLSKEGQRHGNGQRENV